MYSSVIIILLAVLMVPVGMPLMAYVHGTFSYHILPGTDYSGTDDNHQDVVISLESAEINVLSIRTHHALLSVPYETQLRSPYHPPRLFS
jgi:hypothetical protein